MKKEARVVIGANWGDEGKGLMTDYYAARCDAPLVVRFSGGANAGHTVVTPDGRRHVFSHFGSGSFVPNAKTFLSKFFVVNPILYGPERIDLMKIAPQENLRVFVDANAPMTTPFDMMINHALEMSREQRHGSTGVGINETIVRNLNDRFCTFAGYIGFDRRYLERLLKEIRDDYVPARIMELGISMPSNIKAALADDATIDRFLDECALMRASVTFTDEQIISKFDEVIFEGSQGLLLDEDHEFFPHVTRSRTGLVNVCELANSAGIRHLNVTYVTRSYATRHGEGPFPGHAPEMSFEDDTNVPNEWQGSMRFGWLSPDLLIKTILDDVAKSTIPVTKTLCVTHCDQLPYLEVWPIVRELLPDVVLASFGPTREHVSAAGGMILAAKSSSGLGDAL